MIYEVDAFDFLYLGDSVDISSPSIIELEIRHRLVFNNSYNIGGEALETIAHTLGLVQFARYSFVTKKSSHNDSLSLRQLINIEIRGKLPPLPVPGSDTIVAQQPCSTQIVAGPNISLTWNAITLYLPAPKLGNKDNLEFNRIQKKNRGGELILFADPMWPKTLKIDYDFDTLTQEQVRVLQSFIEKSIGQLVTLTDFEGIVRNGIIDTPTLQLKQNHDCDFSVGFSFQVLF